MVYRKRIYYTDTQKAEMWDRWQKGESLYAIARSFDRHHTSVRGILAATGGVRPRERRRSHHVLTLAEREQISRGIVAGNSIRSIAASLGRAATFGWKLYYRVRPTTVIPGFQIYFRFAATMDVPVLLSYVDCQPKYDLQNQRKTATNE